ncbi:unnamed protein product [Pelagomonas calceolata]|uniref:Uncharacterized protein n=1 Tax=Pelagomonas calceolata TaxID=35677 RepID=A0A8J2SQ21_9STRA|nr:unnamed protein product [Pelagomonas calceolata]
MMCRIVKTSIRRGCEPARVVRGGASTAARRFTACAPSRGRRTKSAHASLDDLCAARESLPRRRGGAGLQACYRTTPSPEAQRCDACWSC